MSADLYAAKAGRQGQGPAKLWIPIVSTRSGKCNQNDIVTLTLLNLTSSRTAFSFPTYLYLLEDARVTDHSFARTIRPCSSSCKDISEESTLSRNSRGSISSKNLRGAMMMGLKTSVVATGMISSAESG